VSPSTFDGSLERRLDAAVTHFSAFADAWLTALSEAGEPPAAASARRRYARALAIGFERSSRGVQELGFPHALVLEPLTTALAQRALGPLLSWFQALATARAADSGAGGNLQDMISALAGMNSVEVGLLLAQAQAELLQALLDYQAATRSCEGFSSAMTASSCHRFAECLQAASCKPEWSPGDVRGAYRRWLDCFDQGYSDLLRNDAYAAAFGARLNAATAIALALRRWSASLPDRLAGAVTPTAAKVPQADTAAAAVSERTTASPSPVNGGPLAAANRDIARFQMLAARRLAHLRRAPGAKPGCCARTLLWEHQGMRLYRYRHRSEGPAPTLPLLIVYAMVNRPGMLDLHEGRSLLRGLLQRGLEVYLLDWGDPGSERQHASLADHVLGHLGQCVEQVRRVGGQSQVNLLGICQGGVLALCYAALRPERVARLVTMVTPVDFHADHNTLGGLARYVDFDRLVAATGNVPGGLLNALFLSLSPIRLGVRKYLDLIEHPEDPEALEDFLRMESWIFDSPDQPGQAFAEFARRFIQGNALVRGELQIGDERVDLGRISCPVLNVYATEDHLVPPASARALRGLLRCPSYREYAFPGGHIGIYVSRRAQGRVADELASWLAARH